MSPSEILAIADAPSTPSFAFGSKALQDWNDEHCFRGECNQSSRCYVVIHHSHTPGMPSFRVLSIWRYGQVCPITWDVPSQAALAS